MPVIDELMWYSKRRNMVVGENDIRLELLNRSFEIVVIAIEKIAGKRSYPQHGFVHDCRFVRGYHQQLDFGILIES